MKLEPFERLAAGAWLALAGAAAAIRLGLLRTSTLDAVRLCAFRALTGVPCPGCGMGHALLLAFEGRWADSFRAHPLGAPLLAVWTSWLLWGASNAWAGRRFSERFPLRLGPRSGALALALILAVYALRLRGAWG